MDSTVFPTEGSEAAPEATEPRAVGGRPAAKRWQTAAGRWITKLHGSVYGDCVRAQVAALMGEETEPPGPWLAPLFSTGHESEEKIKPWFAAHGVAVKDKPSIPSQYAVDHGNFAEQIEVKRWMDDRDGGLIMLAAHLDGILSSRAWPFGWHWISGLVPSPGVHVWEHKAMNPEKFEKFMHGGVQAISERYCWQVSGNVVMVREESAKKKKPLHSGIIFSAERRDYDSATKEYKLTGEYAFQFLPEPIYSADLIEERCLHIVNTYLDGVVPDCDGEMCNCKRAKQKEAVIVSPSECVELYEATERYFTRQADIALAQATMKDLRPGIESRVLELGGKIEIGGFLVEARRDRTGRTYFTVRSAP